jgi:hypothetical protein
MGRAAVHVELNRSDARVLMWTSYAWQQVLLSVVLVLAMVGVSNSVWIITRSGVTASFTLMGLYLLYVVGLVWRRIRLARRLTSDISVDDLVVVVATPTSRSERSWSTFRSAHLRRRHLLLKLRTGRVILIPRRCFASTEAESAFCEIVAAHLRVKGRDATALTPVASA